MLKYRTINLREENLICLMSALSTFKKNKNCCWYFLVEIPHLFNFKIYRTKSTIGISEMICMRLGKVLAITQPISYCTYCFFVYVILQLKRSKYSIGSYQEWNFKKNHPIHSNKFYFISSILYFISFEKIFIKLEMIKRDKE